MKKIKSIGLLLGMVLVLIVAVGGCKQEETPIVDLETDIVSEPIDEPTDEPITEPERMTVYDIHSLADIDVFLNQLTLDEKAGQMLQGERGSVQLFELADHNIGSILSGGGSVPSDNSPAGWVDLYNRLQRTSRNSSAGIPLVYGIDAVHGHSNVQGATIFPHNIGLGATHNPDLVEAIGAMTAMEIHATGLNWNFAPAVSVIGDIRWGRTYEGFSEHGEDLALLGASYVKGLQGAGIMATTKHFIGDGYTEFGTGEGSYLLDRGDVTMDIDTLLEIYLPAYEKAIEAGTKSIMISYNSIHDVKMHGHSDLINGVLRDQLGYDGLILSDWEAIAELPGNLENQVASAILSGIDMLMQPYNYLDVKAAIIANVEKDEIPMSRIDEAVRRILIFKYEAGLFTKDYLKTPGEVGTDAAKSVAIDAVAQSMVLLKNEADVLPLQKDMKIYLTGPASDNVGVQCGGWTLSWQGEMIPDLMGGTSIKTAFETVLNAHGGMLVDMPQAADVVVIAIGEQPYAEGFGDVDDLSLTGPMTLEGNAEALALAAQTNKPVVTLMVAGRPRLIEPYVQDWDAFVMAFLPGTEADGIAQVIFGDQPFVGRLPVTWPKTNDQAADTLYKMDYETIDHQFKFGFGLTR